MLIYLPLGAPTAPSQPFAGPAAPPHVPIPVIPLPAVGPAPAALGSQRLFLQAFGIGLLAGIPLGHSFGPGPIHIQELCIQKLRSFGPDLVIGMLLLVMHLVLPSFSQAFGAGLSSTELLAVISGGLLGILLSGSLAYGGIIPIIHIEL